jgi:hypothetical protein
MPTLRVTHIVQEYKSLSSTGTVGETATTADFALFDGLLSSTPTDHPRNHEATARSTCSDHGDGHPANDSMNETTLSGSLLEEALDILRAGRETHRHSSSELKYHPAVLRVDVPSQIEWTEDATSKRCQGDPCSTAAASQQGCLDPPISQESVSVGAGEGGGLAGDDDDDDDEYCCHSFDMPAPPRLDSIRRPGSGEAAACTQAGPNELVYREKYAALIARQILTSGHALRDYRTMASADKEREQERVLALLHRLGIRPLDGGPEKEGAEGGAAVDNSELWMTGEGRKLKLGQHVRHEQVSDAHDSTSKVPVTSGTLECQQSVDPDLAHEVQAKLQISDRPSTRKSVSFAFDNNDESLVLLPPDFENDDHGFNTSTRSEPVTDSAIEREASTPRRTSGEQVPTPLHQDSSAEDDSFLSSDGEIEVARSKLYDLSGHASYDSPTATTPRAELQRKRTATTSGKRGTDTSRTRSSGVPLSYGLPLAASDQSKPFILSTSPIVPYQRHHHERASCSETPNRHQLIVDQDSFGPQDVPLGDSSLSDRSVQANQAVALDDDSILLTSTPTIIGGRQPLRNTSNRFDVRVREGASFHLQPLETRPARQEYFPDPFHIYDGSKLLPRMLRILSKLCRREASVALKPSLTARAIVLSMDMPDIHRLLLKLALEDIPSSSDSTTTPNRGGTLVVARERAQLEDWSRTLREGSSLRVLNHSTLPVVQRKTRSTAESCCKFDVVLTTYDCLKSADVTVNLDANGHVLINDASRAGEWVSSHTTPFHVEGVNYKQLSVLHCLCWKRVVFLDTVGRKSFLCKAETGRAFATRALNSRCRFVTRSFYMFKGCVRQSNSCFCFSAGSCSSRIPIQTRTALALLAPWSNRTAKPSNR